MSEVDHLYCVINSDGVTKPETGVVSDGCGHTEEGVVKDETAQPPPNRSISNSVESRLHHSFCY